MKYFKYKKLHPVVSRKRILVALHWYSQEMHAGINRYAMKAGWEVVVVNNENMGEFQSGGYCGIISMAPEEGHPMHEFIANARVPVVEMSYSYPNRKKWVRSPVDAYRTGQIAARHMEKCPVKSFVFLSIPTNETHDLRWRGFQNVLAQDARPSVRYITDSLSLSSTEKLADFLREKVKEGPVGVVGSVDESARQAYDASLMAELKIPGDIYLMGCGNRDVYTKLTSVPITTVNINEELLGYQAAELLDLYMDGKVSPGFTKAVSPGEVIVRDSTGGHACDNPVCEKAISIMTVNIENPLNVDEIAQQLGVSKTTLNRAFIAVAGIGVAAFYLKMRLEHSQGLLLSGAKIESVANSVGFKSCSAFRSAFCKFANCTPREFVLQKEKNI